MSSISPPFFEHWTTARAPQIGAVLQPIDICTPLLLPLGTVTLEKPTPNYYRPWRPVTAKDDYSTTLTIDKQKFKATLDVQQFAPNEVKVKVIGRNNIVVEAKHEEKQDHHGSVARQFLRRYIVPDGHDLDNIISSLSSDGVLTITAPTLEKLEEQRSIPVLQTGVPATSAEPLAPVSLAVNVPSRALGPGKSLCVGHAAGVAQKSNPEVSKPEEAKEEKQDDEKED